LSYHLMRNPSRLAALLATTTLLAHAQPALIVPRDEAQRTWVQSATKRIGTCFTALGPRIKLPEVAALPPQSEMIAGVLLPISGMPVNDGYNYMLMIHGPSNSGYVVQLGGFAGSQTLFGPLRLDTECAVPAAPAAKSPASVASTTAR
jgi:hypothetical protein